MGKPIQRIAITLGGGYLPGLSGVVRATARAARRRGWDAVGIRDGFDGVLFPERYPGGGIVPVDGEDTDDDGSLLGTGARTDPFRVQRASLDGFLEEHDASPQLLDDLRGAGIDAVVAIVGGSTVTGSHALGVMWKLARRGLTCTCIPKSAENDLAATAQPFGYDSVREYAARCLRRARIAARDQGRVAVVEVPGQYAGWLALDAGLAAGADVILIPEMPYDAAAIAQHLDRQTRPALIVVAAGARRCDAAPGPEDDDRVAHAGGASRQVHESVQQRCSRELFALQLDQWVRAGDVTAADRSLGSAYGAEAVRLLASNRREHIVAAGDGGFEAIPLGEAVNRIRTVGANTPVLRNARSLGISLGERA